MQHVKQLGALGGALVLTAGLASAATAAEWSVNVGGFFNAGVIVSDLDEPKRGRSVYTNPEIFFSPSIQMDNGVTYGARVELEGYTDDGDQIDEHYLYVKGGFGKVTLGAEDAAHYNLHSEAPGGGFDNYNDPSYQAAGGAINTSDYASSDSNGIVYVSPSFSGFQFGVSYKPDVTKSGGSNLTKASDNVLGVIEDDKYEQDYGDAYAIGVKYGTDMDGFSLGFSAGYQMISADLGDNDKVPGTDTGRTDLNDDGRSDKVDREVMIASVSFGVAGATIGGSYKRDDKGSRSKDNEVYNLGVKYQTGDLTLGGGVGIDVETAEIARGDGTKFDQDTTNTAYSVSVTYKLGPGINVGGGLHFYEVEYDEVGKKDEDSAGVVVGIGLSF